MTRGVCPLENRIYELSRLLQRRDHNFARNGSGPRTLLDDALRTNHLERLGITAEDGRDLYHGCDWRYRDGCLSIEGESRDGQEAWLRLLDTRFFQPNGFALSGEVSWDGDQSGDTGVIYVEEHRIEAVAETPQTGDLAGAANSRSSVVDLVRAGRGVLTRWNRATWPLLCGHLLTRCKRSPRCQSLTEVILMFCDFCSATQPCWRFEAQPFATVCGNVVATSDSVGRLATRAAR